MTRSMSSLDFCGVWLLGVVARESKRSSSGGVVAAELAAENELFSSFKVEISLVVDDGAAAVTNFTSEAPSHQ